jgi:hypothetical protein
LLTDQAPSIGEGIVGVFEVFVNILCVIMLS